MAEKKTITVTGGIELLPEGHNAQQVRFNRLVTEAATLIESLMVTTAVRFNPVILAGTPYVANRKVVARLMALVTDADVSDSELIATIRSVWAAGFDPDGSYSTIAVEVVEAGITEASLSMTQMVPPVGVDSFVPGLCAGSVWVIGNTGAGKTTYLRRTFKPDVLIRWGEPSEDIDLEPNVIHTRSYPDTIFLALFLTALGARVAVDSLRVVAYGMKSQAGAKGIAARLPLEATSISLAFSRVKGVGVVALNPLLDEDATTFLVSQIASSTAGAIHLREAGTLVSEAYRTITGRIMAKKVTRLNGDTLTDDILGQLKPVKTSVPDLHIEDRSENSLTEAAWRGAGRPIDAAPGSNPANWSDHENETRQGSVFHIALNLDDEV